MAAVKWGSQCEIIGESLTRVEVENTGDGADTGVEDETDKTKNYEIQKHSSLR